MLALVGLLGALGYRVFRASQNEQAMEALVHAFSGVEVQAELTRLEQALGFSTRQTLFFPQVSMPANPSGLWWHAVAFNGTRQDELNESSAGIIVEWSTDAGIRIADSNLALPAQRRAQDWSSVTWIAFVHKQRFEDAWESAGRTASIDRVDIRILWRGDERLVARGTGEALPASAVRGPLPSAFQLPEDAVTTLVVEALAAAESAPDELPPPPEWTGPCVADSLATPSDLRSDPSCQMGATDACLRSCESGNGRSCAEAAYALEHGDDDAIPAMLFRRACEAGDVNACTNFGAGLRLLENEGAHACAYRIFDWTCAQRDPFGCGMLGAAMAAGNGVDQDAEGARTLLRNSCETLGAFACDVLGSLAVNDLVPRVPVEEAQAAFDRACATQYVPACTKSAREMRATYEARSAASIAATQLEEPRSQ